MSWKKSPLNTMKGGDWIIYYSPTYHFGVKDSYQSFTAIGKITSEEPYRFAMSEDFVPWRRNVDFLESNMISVKPFLESLAFISDKKKWGFHFRRGCFEIKREDFELIAKEMGVVDE